LLLIIFLFLFVKFMCIFLNLQRCLTAYIMPLILFCFIFYWVSDSFFICFWFLHTLIFSWPQSNKNRFVDKLSDVNNLINIIIFKMGTRWLQHPEGSFSISILQFYPFILLNCLFSFEIIFLLISFSFYFSRCACLHLGATNCCKKKCGHSCQLDGLHIY
jgi:Ribosomal L40e family